MSKLLQRVKTVFRRKRRNRKESSTSFADSNNQLTEGYNTAIPYQIPEDRDDNNDETENFRHINPLQRNIPKPSQIDVSSSSDHNGEESPSTSSSRSKQSFRDVPTRARPAPTRNSDINGIARPSLNNNPGPITNSTSQQEYASYKSENQYPPPRPPVNPVSQPPINSVPLPTNGEQSSLSNPVRQSQLRDSTLDLMNKHRELFPIHSDSNLVGFPTNQYRRARNMSYGLDRTTHQNQPYRSLPYPSRNNLSNFEIDYPIEHVLIDGNVPSAIAVKINEAVEYDRFGDAYRTQRYAYEPVVQQLNIGNNQQIQRRLLGNSHRHGRRYIREITNNQPRSQKLCNPSYQIQDLNNIELLIDHMPQLNYQVMPSQIVYDSFSIPINHFIANALPNDPMQIY
ncbi:unnamed protein product [Rotaria socialis]|uniref:Uncharacterized protein n=1 Tax=Rotaria socialis TaxID=392032 RepID=A0A821LU18_9BILA|nr:unnamed protein product [Rotaria socialis]CAF3420561.1 unnamed protein product [Rotaria socialis]CAF3422928.1 unnamed protein product [Rotaria socialis]CAF4240648.1 unnamed protein product [Rotaria socialis]CAF4341079.1 unnamed protein product [Rotaria socialis]